MRKTQIAILMATSLMSPLLANIEIPRNASEDKDGIMAKAYWDMWNDDVQKKIDADIEANRKADATIQIGSIAKGSNVKVEQITHDFKFGAHIFNYNQLGDNALNAKYKSLYGTLFNSATVAFYWNKFEMQPNRPRHNTEYWDTQEYWNNCKNPKEQIHYRRPPTDDIIDYCKSQGIRIHGHAIIWGNRRYSIPHWLYDKCLEGDEKARFSEIVAEGLKEGVKNEPEKFTKKFDKMSVAELDKAFPKLADNMLKLFENRIEYLAKYYGDKVDSWDVVNESLEEFAGDSMNVGGLFCKHYRRYRLMPADYTFKSFQKAQACFPESVKLNINDNPYGPPFMERYDDQVNDLLKRGCKIDIVGWQMHLFNPQTSSEIASGVAPKNPYKAVHFTKVTPEQMWKDFKVMDAVNKPIHMSEITISAPDNTPKGKMIQAIITRNLYRMWFSQKLVMGVTWWNVVDDCGALGEPSISGLFTRTMNPKPAFYALDNLINNEWKTNLELIPDAQGNVKFRGFKGKYRLSWTDAQGNERFKFVYVK